jgi:hypothetical protein
MNKKILLVLLFAIMHIQTKSLCSNADYSNAPKELLRKSVKDNEPGFRYGNPHPILCFLNESIYLHYKTPNR